MSVKAICYTQQQFPENRFLKRHLYIIGKSSNNVKTEKHNLYFVWSAVIIILYHRPINLDFLYLVSFLIHQSLKIVSQHSLKNSHQLMAGPLSRRLCPSISRNNEKKMTPTTVFSTLSRVSFLLLYI